MGLIPLRRAVRWAWWLLALLAALAAFEGWRWWGLARVNAQIASGNLPKDDNPGLAPELRFAQAHALAASGAGEAALNRYGLLQGDSPLGQAARYNAANLLLRQGAALHASAQPGQALALIELAKEGFRAVLRADPNDWNARYNLERAQRLLPEPEEIDESAAESKRDAERAATTMRGNAAGLP
jgi:mxaK protein